MARWSPSGSLINLLRDLHSRTSAGGWMTAEAADMRADDTQIGDFARAPDARFAVAAKEAMDEMLALYDAAKAINARSILGFTYIRVAERKALAAALAKLEA